MWFFVRREMDTINRHLRSAESGKKVSRNWRRWNELKKSCMSKYDSPLPVHESVNNLLESIANMTRLFLRPAAISSNPFQPQLVILERIIQYLAVEDVEFDMLDLRCYDAPKGGDGWGGNKLAPVDPWLNDELQWLRLSRHTAFNLREERDFVLVQAEDWKVASCDGVIKVLSYEFFLNPFDSWTWVTILAIIAFISCFVLGVLIVSSWYVEIANSIWDILYNLLMIGFGLLIGIGTSAHSEITNRKVAIVSFILTFGLWSLMSVILSGAYMGLFISELVSGIPVRTKWQGVSDLDGFIFYSQLAKNLNWDPETYVVKSMQSAVYLAMKEPRPRDLQSAKLTCVGTITDTTPNNTNSGPLAMLRQRICPSIVRIFERGEIGRASCRERV